MSTSKIEEAAGALLRAWGNGPAPAGNCAGVINELRRAYAAEVEAKEQARIESYRKRARDLTVCFDPDRAYNNEEFGVAPDAVVEFDKLAGDRGAWVTMRVFIKSASAGDETAF